MRMPSEAGWIDPIIALVCRVRSEGSSVATYEAASLQRLEAGRALRQLAESESRDVWRTKKGIGYAKIEKIHAYVECRNV
jgi:hypothetical protein